MMDLKCKERHLWTYRIVVVLDRLKLLTHGFKKRCATNKPWIASNKERLESGWKRGLNLIHPRQACCNSQLYAAQLEEAEQHNTWAATKAASCCLTLGKSERERSRDANRESDGSDGEEKPSIPSLLWRLQVCRGNWPGYKVPQAPECIALSIRVFFSGLAVMKILLLTSWMVQNLKKKRGIVQNSRQKLIIKLESVSTYSSVYFLYASQIMNNQHSW